MIIYNDPGANRFDDEKERAVISNIECDCGNKEFLINWISAPYTGGYCKITCSKCGSNDILIDDYA